MNSLFGIFRRDGAPVKSEWLGTMARALPHVGARDAVYWQSESVGFGVLARPSTPEAQFETFPLFSQNNAQILIANARLDNRAELCDAFAIPHTECTVTPDSALILRAYEKWGHACCDRLIGDWTFALWDARTRELFLARDHHGNTALHYYAGSQHFAFASSLNGLLALPFVPRQVNELFVAKVLTAWQPDGFETAYENIYCLPPAHTLTVSAGALRMHRYWFLENVPDVHLKNDAAYVETFVDLFTRAVKDRLRAAQPIAATLSGGLDSSSVCAVAARDMRTRGETLTTYTSIPLQSVDDVVSANRFGDESPLVEQTRAFAGNIDAQYVRAENISPLAAVRRMLEMNLEPAHAAGNHFWIVALLETVQREGKGVLLTGQGGNATISWTGLQVPALQHFWNGRWSDGQRAFDTAYRQYGLYRALRGQIAKPLVHPARGWIQTRRAPAWQDYSAIHPAFAARLSLAEQMRQAGHDPYFRRGDNPRRERFRILLPGRSVLGARWQANGAAFGLDVRDPTLDKRVMEFCIGVPEEQYARAGRNRMLIRRAMDGYLPDTVRLNTRRGIQAADLGFRLVQHHAEMDDALRSLQASPRARAALDLARMQTIWHALQTRVNAETTAPVGTILLRGVMTGFFLLTQENAGIQ